MIEGKDRNIPFKLDSSVKKAISCDAEPKILSNEDIKNLIQEFIKNRDDFPRPDRPRPPDL